ncbi:MAG: hypothetical protein AB4050_04865 [Synechococcus sp.]
MREPKKAAQRDLERCLLTWLALEGLCFAAMPLLQVYPFEVVEFWFFPSLAFGLIGSFIISFSSGAVVEAQNTLDPRKKRRRFWLARSLGMTGFLGVSFPLTLTLISFGNVLKEFGDTL